MDLPEGFRFVIHDGGGQCNATRDTVFTAAGMPAITTPPRAPRANAFAERWVRTLRHELLDRTLIWNERQSGRCSSSTSSTTTPSGPTGRFTSAHPTTPVSPRSHLAGRSIDTAPMAGSSTSTAPPPNGRRRYPGHRYHSRQRATHRRAPPLTRSPPPRSRSNRSLLGPFRTAM